MGAKRILNLVFAAIAAVCLWGVAVSTSSRPAHTIRIGILASPDDEDYHGAVAFRRHVEAAAKGRVAVEIFTSGQYCGGERECVENLQAGVLDVFMTTFGGFGGFYGPGQAFDLPYLFRDDAIAECVLDGPLADDLRETVLAEGLGLRLMTIGNTGGWRSVATTKRLVRAPDDFRGLKIRTIPSPLQQELVRALGANPTPIAWSELYLALATGVVEGTKNSVQDIVSMKLHEHIKFITVDNHAYMGAIWWYSERNWRALPPDLQAIVTEGFTALRDVTRALPKERQAAAFETFRAAGGVVHHPGPEEWRTLKDAVRDIRPWFERRYGADWPPRLDAAIADCERTLARGE